MFSTPRPRSPRSESQTSFVKKSENKEQRQAFFERPVNGTPRLETFSNQKLTVHLPPTQPPVVTELDEFVDDITCSWTGEKDDLFDIYPQLSHLDMKKTLDFYLSVESGRKTPTINIDLEGNNNDSILIPEYCDKDSFCEFEEIETNFVPIPC